MTIKETFVFTYIDEDLVLCGQLKMSDERRNPFAKFEYVGSYLSNKKAYAIDPSLPLKEGEFETESGFSCFGAIRDASPDGWGRHILDRINEVGELSEFEYIVQSSGDRVGALAFGSSPLKPERKSTNGKKIEVYGEFFTMEELLKVVKIGDNYRKNVLSEETRRFLIRGSSLGGARPKGTTTDNENNIWLAKFSRQSDSTNQPLIEYANMKLAQELGLDVPDIKYIRIGEDGTGVYLIKRFDRCFNSNGRIIKKPFISSLTALGAHESDMGSGMWGYSDISKFILTQLSDHKKVHKELFKRMVFNIMCGNTDDHLRNHGFLYNHNNANWELSPLYDVVPQASVGQEKKLCLNVFNKDRNADLNNAILASSNFYLSTDDAKNIVNEMILICQHWREIYKNLGVSDADIASLENSFSEVNNFISSNNSIVLVENTKANFFNIPRTIEVHTSNVDLEKAVFYHCQSASCKGDNPPTKLRGDRKKTGICSYCDED